MFNDISSWIFTELLCLCLIISSVCAKDFNSSFTSEHVKHLRKETKDLFKHAWTSYIDYGFPHDEVRPITCEPYGPDYGNMYNIIRNDAMGNISSTVLDNLDTLIIMEEWDQFEIMLDYLHEERETLFIKNTIVQVFESTIRSLGGLLSTHLLLTDVTKRRHVPDKYKKFKEISDNYDGFLLDLAYDLGLRLIPAFKTSNNIPFPRINLAKGLKAVPTKLQGENCLSGATTPVLEFTLLSKLTGDAQFEYFSQATYWKLWTSRSNLNLLPMTINPSLNQWMDSITGIGASIDSFYEYSAKSYILFNDPYMWSVFKSSYKALLTHSVIGGGPNEGSMVFTNVGVYDGYVKSDWIDSLGAFWPGLQVLTGQLTDAIKTHLVYLKIWNAFDSIPERWNYYVQDNDDDKKVDIEMVMPLEWYPLRPEFIESTYYLYRATKDPMYLQIGERILNLFKFKFKAECGFAGFQDIRTGKMQNRMETFVMGETLKYLFLLFDVNDEIFLHNDLMKNKNWIFSTEAHPLWLNKDVEYRQPDGPLRTPETKKESNWIKSLLSSKESSSDYDNKDSPFYRNITMPAITSVDIPGMEDSVGKFDPYAARFDTCEANPFTPHTNSFMSSSYYTWDQMFNPDYTYRRTLVKPPHTSQSALDGSCIELTPSFYEKFTMFSPVPNKLHLQCLRSATTEQYELFLGDMNNINSVEISQVSVHSYPHKLHTRNDQYALQKSELLTLQNGDLWVPHLNALRVRVEVLAEGSIDTTNTLITQNYLESFLPDISHYDSIHDSVPLESLTSPAKVLRLIKLNGLALDPETVVWTLPFSPMVMQEDEPPVLYVNNNRRVVLNGSIIENVMVWGG